jgi:hypothetical protein
MEPAKQTDYDIMNGLNAHMLEMRLLLARVEGISAALSAAYAHRASRLKITDLQGKTLLSIAAVATEIQASFLEAVQRRLLEHCDTRVTSQVAIVRVGVESLVTSVPGNCGCWEAAYKALKDAERVVRRAPAFTRPVA